MPEVARTLVKSPPELWAEVSDPDALSRHLGAFGDIRITRLEPEATVAWEGTRARGTVDLQPAGWGTKVTVTAEEIDAPQPPEDPDRTTATAAPAPAPHPPEAAAPVQHVHPAPEERPGHDAVAAAAPTVAPEPTPDVPQRGRVGGLLSRLFGRRKAAVPQTPEEPAGPVGAQPTVELSAAARSSLDPDAVLDDMLASLGSARHRPFSRG